MPSETFITYDATPWSPETLYLFRLFQSSNIPKQLYEIMGRWRAFREVSRVTAPAPGAADYTVSGTLDYKENRVRAPYYHEINVKGILRVRVARAGDGVLILDKDFVDDQTDSASSFQPIRVLYLQEAFFQKIAAEIRKTVEGDVRQTGAKGAPPK